MYLRLQSVIISLLWGPCMYHISTWTLAADDDDDDDDDDADDDDDDDSHPA